MEFLHCFFVVVSVVVCVTKVIAIFAYYFCCYLYMCCVTSQLPTQSMPSEVSRLTTLPAALWIFPPPSFALLFSFYYVLWQILLRHARLRWHALLSAPVHAVTCRLRRKAGSRQAKVILFNNSLIVHFFTSYFTFLLPLPALLLPGMVIFLVASCRLLPEVALLTQRTNASTCNSSSSKCHALHIEGVEGAATDNGDWQRW